jgi:hypothetical protein
MLLVVVLLWLGLVVLLLGYWLHQFDVLNAIQQEKEVKPWLLDRVLGLLPFWAEGFLLASLLVVMAVLVCLSRAI